MQNPILRISIVKVNNEGSIGMSRNTILNKSRGEWIAFLDSDDWWTEDKLEKCANYFQVGIDLIYHDLIVVDERYDRTQSMKIKLLLFDEYEMVWSSVKLFLVDENLYFSFW
jgi:glycosyltransferase involved in cell wall biosynthesis